MYHERYAQIRESEKSVKEILVEFQDDYPGVLSGDNLDSIVENKAGKLNMADVIARLKGKL